MKLKSIFSVIFTLMIATVIISCSTDTKPEEKNATEEKHAYIIVSISEGSFTRAAKEITPDSLERDNLSYVLKGKGPSASGFNQLGIWKTYSELENMTKIEVAPGEWQFILEASKNNSTVLTKTIKKAISYGDNPLIFELEEPETGTGNIDVTFTFPSGIEKVTVELFDSKDNSVNTKDFYIAEGSTKSTIEYKNSVEKGEYKLCFYLYPNKNDTDYLDSYSVMAKVKPGCSTTGTEEVTELSTVYSINYILNDGEWDEGITIPLCYYKNSRTITLPENLSKPNAIFWGWYTNKDFTGERVTQIPSGSEENKTFYARWWNPEIPCTEITCTVKDLYDLKKGISNCSFTVHITDKNPLSAEQSPSFRGTILKLKDSNININLDLSACKELTVINREAFATCSNLTGIIIPDSVTSIGEHAFLGCTGLTSIAIPDSVTSIGNNAFSSCTGLTSITIPDSVTSIGDSSFDYCTGLTSITIPDSVTSIGSGAFSRCTGLTSITIPDSVTSIGSGAFSRCTGLTSITIPDSVTNIGIEAFSRCTGLTSITIPSSVTSIGESAFSSCSSLEEITIPFVGGYLNTTDTNWTTLFGYIFNMTSYTGILTYDKIRQTIPTSLRTVTVTGGKLLYGAFCNCSRLTSITIPDSVTSIGDYAFYGCTGLTSITIPENVTSIGDYAFYGCTGLTSITIPDSVTSIGNYAFYGCTGLTNITIPDSVTSISNNVFSGCTGLTSITIPDSVSSIGSDAFSGCTGLKSIAISDSVTSIVSYTFYGCTGLTSITIPDSVTSIGNYAFYGCSGLKSITIPDSVTSIGNDAFYGCTGLKSITIPDSVISIPKGVFSRCSSLEEITIPFVGGSSNATGSRLFGYIFGNSGYTGGTKIEQFYDSNNFETYYIPSTLHTVTVTGGKISAYAFNNCTGLTSITISDGVTSIGYSAFSGCTGLTNITIPDSVTSIGNSAFSGCTGLTNITIPDSVTSIEHDAFYGCTGLTSITIPDSVTSIGNYAFYGCTGLTSITIPDSVTSIGNYSTFSGCKGLKSITIPSSVKRIPEGTFSGCSSLEEITIPFVGGSSNATKADTTTVFGYIFGTSHYLGGEATEQRGKTYYIPKTLQSVTITSGIIFSKAFYNCSNLKSVTIGNDVTSIEEKAFFCSGLTQAFFNDTISNWYKDGTNIGPMSETDIKANAVLLRNGNALSKMQ